MNEQSIGSALTHYYNAGSLVRKQINHYLFEKLESDYCREIRFYNNCFVTIDGEGCVELAGLYIDKDNKLVAYADDRQYTVAQYDNKDGEYDMAYINVQSVIDIYHNFQHTMAYLQSQNS